MASHFRSVSLCYRRKGFIMIDINYCSQKGLCDTNQDFILCKQLQDGSCIAILADGMGGLQYGEIAAQLQISVAYFCSIGLYFLV